MPLRDYQQAAVDGFAQAFKSGAQSACVSMATGTGKSLVFRTIAERAADKGNRSLLIVRGDALVRQAAKHFRSSGLTVGVEMGKLRAKGDEQVVVGSIDTLRRRLKRFPRDAFSVVQVDECHRAYSVGFLRTLAHFGFSVPAVDENGNICEEEKTERVGDARLLGYTATPDRGDKRDIMRIFDELAFEYGIQPAIDDGWLVPIRQELCTLDGLDLSAVRRTAGDLNAADLAKVLEPLLEPMAEEIVKVAGCRPTLIYSPLVTLAEQMTDVLRRLDPDPRVETITGETPPETRKDWFDAFQRGFIARFSSVGTLTEGVDLPAASVLAVCRLTTVRALYAQIVGRGLRLPPGVNDLPTAAARKAAIAASSKPYATVLDFAGNSGKHKLCRVIDLFDEDLPDGIRAGIEARMDEFGGDPQLAIDAALEEIRRMEAEIRGKQIKRILVDPFAMLEMSGQKDPWGRDASDRQLEALVNFGLVPIRKAKTPLGQKQARVEAIEKAKRMFDFRTASEALDKLMGRSDANAATMKQVRLLMRSGVPHKKALDMSMSQATEAIDGLVKTGWKPSTAWLSRWAE